MRNHWIAINRKVRGCLPKLVRILNKLNKTNTRDGQRQTRTSTPTNFDKGFGYWKEAGFNGFLNLIFFFFLVSSNSIDPESWRILLVHDRVGSLVKNNRFMRTGTILILLISNERGKRKYHDEGREIAHVYVRLRERKTTGILLEIIKAT